MNASPLALALMLALPALLGAAILRAAGLSWRSDRIAFAGWCWVAGTLGTGLVMFGWLWTGIAPRSPWVPGAAIAVAPAVLFRLARRRDVVTAGVVPPFPAWERAFFHVVLAAAVLLVVERIVAGGLKPILLTDEAQFWALKSKILYASGGFNEAYRDAMADPLRLVYHKDYPILNLLLQVWAFCHAGTMTQVANRLPIVLFALAHVLIVASALRRVVRPAIAALLLVVLVTPPRMAEWAGDAGAEMMSATAAVLMLDGWLRWQRERKASWLALAAFAAALGLWSKNEGLFYVACAAAGGVVAWILRPSPAALRPRPAHAWLLVPAAVFGLHLWFNAHHGYVSAFSEAEGGTLLQLFFARVADVGPTVFGWFVAELMLEPGRNNLLVLAFLALVTLFPSVLRRRHLLPVTLALIAAWFGFMAIFVAHPLPPPSDVEWAMRNAAPRVTFQLYGCFIVWLGCAWSLLAAGSPDESFPACRRESEGTAAPNGVQPGPGS